MSEYKALVSWSGALSVGLDDIDRQHSALVDLLNEFYRAVLALRGQDELAVILGRMNDYTVEHFTYEESSMRQMGYPDLDRHRSEHQSYVDYVEGLHRRMTGGDFISSLEVLGYLREWLTKHIQSQDREFGLWANRGEL